MKKVCDFLSRYMGAIVLLAAVVSLFFPKNFVWIGTSTINPLLGLVMFGMGLTLNPSDFKVVFSRPKDVIIGCLSQFTIMPLMAWLLAKVFQLPPEFALGVILVGSCPGGTASNLITYLAKGDLALSVGITSTSTVLAPILTPFFVWVMAGTFVHVDAVSMFLSILQVVILPIAVGFVIQKYCPRFTSRAVSFLPAFSSVAIVLIVGIVVSHNAGRLLTSGLLIILVVVLHNICGLLLGFAVGKMLKLEYRKCVAISIEVGMQNSGLACSLAAIHFAAFPLATIPGAIFSVWHNISGAMMAKVYGSWLGKQVIRKEGKCSDF